MIRETARVIDQTAPHQLVVAKVLGALNCTELLRVIKTEGAHAFAATTDGMADMRGAADIVVSFDGGFKYGLAIEVKTTTQTDASAGPFKLFKAVKSLERNQRQFDRLINSTPAWWYLVVHIGKLTAKTVSEMDRALLDCPAVIFEGQHADATPDEVLGVKPLGELLDLVSDRLKLLGAPAPLPSPQVQLDMLDDVPVVTLDTPLKAPVWSAPLSVLKPDRVIDNISVPTAISALAREWDAIGSKTMRERIESIPALDIDYRQLLVERDENLAQFLISYVPGFEYRRFLQKMGVHDVIVLSIAADRRCRDEVVPRNRKRAAVLMPEAVYKVWKKRDGKRVLEGVNLLSRVGAMLCRP